MSINKKALIERVFLKTGQPKNEVETLLDATLEEIISSLNKVKASAFRTSVRFTSNKEEKVAFLNSTRPNGYARY